MKIKSSIFIIRLKKILHFVFFPQLIKYFFKGIFPAFEHLKAIQKINNTKTLIDCGSNKGQFAILIHQVNRLKTYFAFDPIERPNILINYFFSKKVNCKYFNIALSNKRMKSDFFITKKKDSSSLKKTLSFSDSIFKGVKYESSITVDVQELNEYEELIKYSPSPRLLKIDVQGEEYNLLLGSNKIFKYLDAIIVEITLFSVYEGVNFSERDICCFLSKNNFKVGLIYNKIWKNGKLISADYLFLRKN